MLKAGFAQRCITPQKPMTLAGFDRRSAPSAGVLDDLYVSVLALLDSGQPLLLCGFDLLGVDRALCHRVCQALPLPRHRAVLWATHTHSAPRGAFSGGISQDDQYIAFLAEACADAARQALEDLSPASAFWGLTHGEGIASLRDKPREAARFAMPLHRLQLRREKDTLQFTRLCCHPTVLDESNLLISRDLAFGQGLWCNGPCADLSTRFTRQGSSPRELARLRQLLKTAEATMEYTPTPALGGDFPAVFRTLELPCGESLRGAAREALLADLRQQLVLCRDPAARRELDACAAVLERGDRDLPPTRAVTVGACDLGAFVLLTLPFEVSFADGQALEHRAARLCGKPALLLCYSGGYDGYLPHETRGINYQDLAAGFAPQARSMIRQGLLDCAAESLQKRRSYYE